MDDFNRSLKFVLDHENVYARGHYGDPAYVVAECEPGDAGGVTKYGIDSRSHGDLDVANLTLEQASLIYKREYWERSHAYEMPWPLCLVQLDGAVNAGIGQQNKFLQRAVGVVADGAWGPNTRRAVEHEVHDLGPVEISRHIIEQRELFYRALAINKPHNARFLQGWLNRLTDLRKECGLEDLTLTSVNKPLRPLVDLE